MNPIDMLATLWLFKEVTGVVIGLAWLYFIGGLFLFVWLEEKGYVEEPKSYIKTLGLCLVSYFIFLKVFIFDIK